MSGGDVMASPRCPDVYPKGLKAQEGIECSAGLNHLLAATDRCSDQRPVGDAVGAGTRKATSWQANSANDMRARLADEASRLGSGENPCSANPGRGCGMK
jgi:hypothetical protein